VQCAVVDKGKAVQGAPRRDIHGTQLVGGPGKGQHVPHSAPVNRVKHPAGGFHVGVDKVVDPQYRRFAAVVKTRILTVPYPGNLDQLGITGSGKPADDHIKLVGIGYAYQGFRLGDARFFQSINTVSFIVNHQTVQTVRGMPGPFLVGLDKGNFMIFLDKTLSQGKSDPARAYNYNTHGPYSNLLTALIIYR
jgi:hypothetical protein